ncbi:hypothetical protein DIE14_00520 [Burkholderia sp. Bp9017]|nr:hypothetical protein DIE14_00520 [Burkholderia sp. Bp9017]RQZ37573.1 hypothetical protein DIE13_00510 [Burkholderia sp. Bp9016]
MKQTQQYPGQLARTVRRAWCHVLRDGRDGRGMLMQPPGARRMRCRSDVRRAAPARTAMSHGDSAAAHHICASPHAGASRAAHCGDAFDHR